eukprot:PhF_6_TR4323/c0_g1_i1/m.5829
MADDSLMLTVQKLLDNMDSVVHVQHATTVDDTLWRNLVLTMSRKIHLMDLEMQKQNEELRALREEVHLMKLPHSLEQVHNKFLQRDVVALQNEVHSLQTIQRQMTAGMRTDDGTSSGLTILATSTGGPADKAQLHVGDVITRFNGRSVRTRADLAHAMETVTVGQNVEVVYCKSTGEGPFRTFIQVAPTTATT